MERASIKECVERRMHIVYNSKGDKKVVFDDDGVKMLPSELENIEVSDLTETLNDFATKLYLEPNHVSQWSQKDEVSQPQQEDVSMTEGFETGGEAITGVKLVITKRNKNSAKAIAQLSIDEANNYSKRQFIDGVRKLDGEFTEFCHEIFKIHEFFTVHEGCWCIDAVVLPEEVFEELQTSHYPFNKYDIKIEECKVYNGSRYLHDPADIVQRSINKNQYDKTTFIELIERLTFNQFQTFCKDVFCLTHDTWV